MITETCPNCAASQEISAGAPGFRCAACEEDVRFMRCRRCPYRFVLHGSIVGSGSAVVTIKCPGCRAKNHFTASQLREVARLARQAQRAQKAEQRARLADERESKRLHAEARQIEVENLNEELEEKVKSLNGLLLATLEVDDYIDFESLKEEAVAAPFLAGELGKEEPPPSLDNFLPPAPAGLGRLLGKSKYQEQKVQGEAAYRQAVAAYAERERQRLRQLLAAQAENELKGRALEDERAKQHAEIEDLREKFKKGDPGAIVSYFTQVLEASDYPAEFPRHTKMAFVPESKQLVVEFSLPPIEVVPEVRGHKYVKAKDEIAQTSRPQREITALYVSVISQVALRTIHELFEADREGKVDTIVFNGFVETTDKRTGKRISPYLITVRTTRDAFQELDLGHVDPLECLRGLQASVSRSPAELAPVRPVVDFSMVDSRFVEESDILSTLDQRPNLMDLTPGEFESLITNVFERMGLETRMTQPSRDGGVDCVAWDQRPIFGGKVVIQAKRYKNTVGVSAVRDLYGTVQNEGASKGILVTTSGYGKAAFDFASGKPLELLDGGNLLFLLKEHAEMDAKIEVPEDWVDPSPGMVEP